jgi:transposase
VERAVEPWRRQLRNAALATVRFETPPGRQLQADFGQCLVSIGGERVRVHLAVLTLGYSRRLLVRAFRSEKQDHVPRQPPWPIRDNQVGRWGS